jgi:outer membrane protein assembly factor BamB
MRRMRCLTSVFCAVLALVAFPLQAADWPQFRGGNRDGVAVEKTAPLEWGPATNIVWQQKLPAAGNSSPIVSRGKVFLACAEDRQGRGRSLYCFDRTNGKVLWKQTVIWNQPDPTHGQNPYFPTITNANRPRTKSVNSWASRSR